MGLLVGAVIGGIGRGEGVVIGSIVGIILGVLVGNKIKQAAAADKRVGMLEEVVNQLIERVKLLERSLESGMVTTPAPVADALPLGVAPPVPEVPVPVSAIVEAVPVETDPSALSMPIERVPAPPATPKEPSALWNFFFGGNTLVRVGIMVLFIGVAFLLKYATDRGFVPIELRLAGVAAGGISLLVLGWRLRYKRAGYALMLQGGGVGVLYFTVFAGLRLYNLLPPTLAFILLAGIAFFSALLAIVQDSKALAITGAAGGFLAPICKREMARVVARGGILAAGNRSVVGVRLADRSLCRRPPCLAADSVGNRPRCADFYLCGAWCKPGLAGRWCRLRSRCSGVCWRWARCSLPRNTQVSVVCARCGSWEQRCWPW